MNESIINETKIDMPDHVKRKIINFFMKTSVPRILAEERNESK